MLGFKKSRDRLKIISGDNTDGVGGDAKPGAGTGSLPKPRNIDLSVLKNKPNVPPRPEIVVKERVAEERRATRQGPQIFSVLVDHSASMEEGDKAQEATRVLQDFLRYTSEVNLGHHGAAYMLTQIALFAEKVEDVTGGIGEPPTVFTPEESFTVRHPKDPERLGNVTNYAVALELVIKTLQEGMSPERLRAMMPAPVVLFISDGKPNRPEDEAVASKQALLAPEQLKGLKLPDGENRHPTREMLYYPSTNVRLVTIGLGTGEDLDEDLLKDMASEGEWKGERFPLYLHCPTSAQLSRIGAQIIGSLTRADKEKLVTLEEAVWQIRHGIEPA